MNNGNNNNSFNNSFPNSSKTPPKDLLSLSSKAPTKVSISNNSNIFNSNNKFIISNQDYNNINTSLGNNLKSNNNNINSSNNNSNVSSINNLETQTTNKFIDNNGLNTNNTFIKQNIRNNTNTNQTVQVNTQNFNNNTYPNNINPQEIQQSENKFITNESNSNIKNININSNSIFNVSNNQNMILNSNNSTYPNYNNVNKTSVSNTVVNNSTTNNINQNIQAIDNVVDKQKQKTDKLMKKTFVPLVELEHKTIRQNKMFMGILIGSVAVFIVVISIALFASGTKISFFGGSPYYSNIKHEKTSDGETLVAVENTWKNVSVSTKEEAYELIRKDSETQKQRCRDELGIKYEKVEQMEKKLEKEYNIIAVNLCEMDIDYLINLEKKIKKVYQEFPMLKNYMTNFSIGNNSYLDPNNQGVIAQFNPANTFATPKSFCPKCRQILYSNT